MKSIQREIEYHYGQGNLLNSILDALRKTGKNPARLKPSDLAPVDEFHIRGREATVELARRASLKPGDCVLDVGSGLGGSARYLATEYECDVTGIDITQEYIDVANALAELTGLEKIVNFKQASALDLPFEDNTFDVAWTEHVQMNIIDKRTFYGEIARVTKPGGLLLFHDIFKGENETIHYPVPWADDKSINFLVTSEEIREIIAELCFSIQTWEDKSRASLEWFEQIVEKLQETGPPPLGFHLLTGKHAKEKFENQIRNLKENRFVVAHAVLKKR